MNTRCCQLYSRKRNGEKPSACSLPKKILSNSWGQHMSRGKKTHTHTTCKSIRTKQRVITNMQKRYTKRKQSKTKSLILWHPQGSLHSDWFASYYSNINVSSQMKLELHWLSTGPNLGIYFVLSYWIVPFIQTSYQNSSICNQGFPWNPVKKETTLLTINLFLNLLSVTVASRNALI